MYSNGAIHKTTTRLDEDVNRLIDSFKSKLDVEIIESVLINTTYNVHEARKILHDLCGYSSQLELPNQGTPRETVTIHRIPNKSYKEKCVDQALEQYHAGYKLFIILRGPPGCGKTYLARNIIRDCKRDSYVSHIFSTDSYFIKPNGMYNYNSRKIPEAHMWNQTRVLQALMRDVNPIIIDNTNTCMWEMRSYATFAVQYGYLIEILEPYTSWCFNIKELTHRNRHGVPKDKIRDMLDRYEKNITTEKLLCAYNLKQHYKPIKDPNRVEIVKTEQNNEESEIVSAGEGASGQNYQKLSEESQPNNLIDFSQVSTRKMYPELNLETWGVNENALVSWGLVLPLNENKPKNLAASNTETTMAEVISTKDASTSISENNFRKSDHEDDVYYIYGEGREINENVPFVECKIRKKTMLDKSSMTEEEYTNMSEIEDLKKLYEVFTSIGRKYLRDMYFRCNRDINWTLDILTDSANLEILNLESVDNNQENEASGIEFEQVANTDSKKWNVDDVNMVQQNGNFAESNTNFKTSNINDTKFEEFDLNDSNFKRLIANVKKIADGCEETITENNRKRHTDLGASNMDNETLKEYIEDKIKINPAHYSKNIIKIKKMRGEINDTDIDLISFDDVQDATKDCNQSGCPISINSDNEKPSTSKFDAYSTQSGTILAMDTDAEISDYSESEDNSTSSGDDKFELNLGRDLVGQLENKFSDVGISYPKGFQPVVQIPIDLARQLHALYIESCFQQLEAQNQVLQMIIKEDEELALKLHMEELKLTNDDHDTPNLKEIMDEQAAISIYHKEVNSLRKCTAEDLATLLTKQKLKKAFPTIAEDTLMEIYQANDRNYAETVQCLVSSVNYLPDKQESNLMDPPIAPSVLQDMKNAQEKTPMSLLENNDNRSPEEYRALANKHLQMRQDFFERANRYYQQGMYPVAAFYSNLATEQTKYFDQANAFAAAALIASNQSNTYTLDLHNLYVKEAINALDIFLDSHIAHLLNSKNINCNLHIITGRGNNSKNGIPKVRPAVVKQLKNRGLTYSVVNPGLLRVKIYKNRLARKQM